MLCTQILNGVESSLKAVSLNPGQDFEVVSVSFDPKDTPELAAAKKQMYLRRYGRPNTANGWHFLTGDEANIKALTDAVGFHYKYDPATDQFAHASGIMILTPDGRVSRYFYGVEYAPRDMRLGLVEASQNKIGNPVDQILLFCYHYDPATGKYGAVAMNLLRAAGAGFVLICGAFLLIVLRRELRAGQEHGALRRGLDNSKWDCYVYFRNRRPPSRPTWTTCCTSCWRLRSSSRWLIFCSIFYFAIRYRRRSENELPRASHGGMALEILWTVIPFGLTMVMFTWGASIFFNESRPPDNAMQIYVVGKQWMWKLQHMEGQREINELHIPVGRRGEAHHDVRRRDPQLLRAGLPHQAGRGARPLHHHLVQAHQAGQVSPVLRRVLRHQPFAA